MLISVMIQDIRNRLDDRDGVGDFEDDQLISFINQAINYIGNYFIAAQNPKAVKTITVNEGDTLPSDFVKTCGNFPMLIEGEVVELFNPKKPLSIKYFYQLPNVSASADSFPLNDSVSANLAVQLVVNFAMNQQKMAITQDQAITTEMMSMINQAYGYSGSTT